MAQVLNSILALDLIALSYPIFAVLIALEWTLARRRGLTVYRFADSLTDLACGVGSQALGLVLRLAALALYAFVYQFRWFTLPSDHVLTWLAIFLLVDLAFYWWHRFSHEMHFLWAAHVVHHQSEDFNLAVALRQEALSAITHVPFHLPLALFGFHPALLATHMAISLLYQFGLHTELVRRLGPVELLLNTPMHHRVHHAINPQYLDKNYGGILIVWDKLFGTYAPEVQPCVYGTVKPLASWNSLWANLIVWQNMVQLSKKATNFRDKLGVWLKSPAWTPPGLPPYPIHEVDRAQVVKYDTVVPRRLKVWLAAQFALTSGVLSLLRVATLPVQVLAGVLILWSLLSLGGLLENRPWALPWERARLGVSMLACALLAFLGLPWLILLPVALVSLVLLATLPLAITESAVLVQEPLATDAKATSPAG